MIETLSRYEIAGRLASDENSSFSYSGGLALADFLEEMEDENNPTEFDRVAIRCDFREYGTLHEWAREHFPNWRKNLEDWRSFFDFSDEDDWSLQGPSGEIFEPEYDQEKIDGIIRDYINDHGTLIEFDGGIIVSSF